MTCRLVCLSTVVLVINEAQALDGVIGVIQERSPSRSWIIRMYSWTSYSLVSSSITILRRLWLVVVMIVSPSHTPLSIVDAKNIYLVTIASQIKCLVKHTGTWYVDDVLLHTW